GDTVDYSSKVGDYLNVNLNDITNSYADAVIGAETDKLKNIENIKGTIKNDFISGDDDSNLLDGFQGDDILIGAGGSDTLLGGDGDDIFKAGLDTNGDDVLEDADDGVDYIIGGEVDENNSGDTVDYSALSSSINVDLSNIDAGNNNYVIVNVDASSNDYIKEIENIIGSSANDIIKGDANANILKGDEGNDTLAGGAGADTLDGGTGVNRVDYSNAAGKIVVDMENATEVSIDGDGSSDELISIQEIVGSYASDTIYGSNSENELFIGGAASDTFMGRGGDDTIYGGSEDRLTDNLLDLVTYEYLSDGTQSVTVDLENETARVYDNSSNLLETDTLYDVENIKGGEGNDTFITKYDETNVINGAGGTSDTIDYTSLDTSHSINVNLEDNGASTTVDVSDTTNDDTILNIENIIGSNRDDTISGNNLANILKGNGGNDTLEGEGGNDTLDGGSGTDTATYANSSDGVTVDLGTTTSQNISASQGSDTLIDIENVIGSSLDDTFYSDHTSANNLNGSTHGANGDTVDYTNLQNQKDGLNFTGEVSVDYIIADLSGATDTVTIKSSGTDVVDTLENIENITGSAGNDTITGDGNKNTLKGQEGDDIIAGGAGDDYIDGGTDTNGDTVNYSDASSGINVNLGIDGVSQNVGGGAGNDTLTDIENVIGSAYADVFKGNNNEANTFNGGITDLSNLNSEHINDENDTVDYSSLTGANDKIVVDLSNTASANVDVTLSSVAQESDTLVNIENVIGTSGNDTFTGNRDSNSLNAGDGDDTFYVKEAAISGESDIIVGGNNTSIGDTVDFSQVSDNTLYVDVNLSSQSLELKNTSNTTVRNDNVSGIENIVGTDNEDFITGDNSNNTLKGEAGTDTIRGNDGDDYILGGANTDDNTTATQYEYLDGGAGADIIYGGAGNDSILGGIGDGKDTLYGEAGNDIIYAGAGVDTVYAGLDNDFISGEAGTDLLYGGLGNDEIKGGSESDIIYGDDDQVSAGGGDDTLYGDSGDDIIYAGSGNDTLFGGANDDILHGDTGVDTVDYSNATNGIEVNFVTNRGTGEGTDELYNIENAVGSKYDDTFISKLDVSNKFDGNDDESGETNGDSISYEGITVNDATEDKVVIDLSSGADGDGYYSADIYQGGTTTISDYLKDMENITGSAGNDTITGDDDANTLKGLAGDDIISGQGGNDYIDGGEGSDTIDYSDENLSVTVDFKNNQASTNAPEVDTIVSIENAIGGTSSDMFIMNEDQKTNTINGGIGAGDLNDTISYENYTSSINVDLGDTNPQLVSTLDTDTILNIEHLIGSQSDDNITGSNVNNSIEGGKGNDTFITGTGDGADYFDGGIGTNDTIDYSAIDSAAANAQGITVTLDGANEKTVIVHNDVNNDNDKVLNVENVIGTQDNDYIKGDVQNNTLFGQNGNDTLFGEDGSDDLRGEVGNDILDGGSGEDTLKGGDGDDTLTGGVGNDTIYGGNEASDTGNDTVDYSNAIESLIIDLDVSLAGGIAGTETYGKSDGNNSEQGQGDDTLYGIENVIGSDDEVRSDSIYGSNGVNTIIAQRGDDYIEARNGADTVLAGEGNDTIKATIALDGADKYDGGNGNADTLDYSSLSENISVNIGQNATHKFETGNGNDSWEVDITDGDNDIIKGFENIVGGSGDDTIFADSNNNSLYGADGADTLSGGAGADTINGAGGNDTISYAYLDNTKNLRLDLLNDTSTVIGDSLDDDTIYSIENAIGGAGNDSMQGTNGDNILQGGNTGNDTFVGLSGDDTIYGGTFNGVTHTDSGSDTVDYTSENKISVTLQDDANIVSTVTIDSNNNTTFENDGSDERDSLYGIENIKGSDSAINGADTIIGNSASNTIYGQKGDDTLNGMAGSDYLYGGDGADTIIGGANADYLYGDAGNDSFNVGSTLISDYSGDIIDGGSEIDTINYNTIDTSGFTQGVEIVLQAGSPANVYVDGSTTVHHTITNVENVIGTDLKDIITGDNQANTISGMAGDDILKGNALSDILYGGDGADELWGEEGSDLLEGGADNDIIRGGSGFDILRGDAGADSIYGGADADQIYGGADNDYIEGGDDNDTIIGEAGNDTIRGDKGNDIIAGGTVTISAGAVTASVDDGNADTVDYSGALTSMTVDLETDDNTDLASKGEASSSNLNDQGTDELYDIENVIGSEENDTIKGSSENNILEGRSGDDTIWGEVGADTLYGGNDNDTLYGGVGTDSIDGEAGNDEIYGGADADTLTGGIGNDTFYATAQDDGADSIDGGTNANDSDTIDYSALTNSNNKIVATLDENIDTDSSVQVYDNTGTLQHTDTIRNIENITGTSGNDTFTGNTSANILIGGDGIDKANYNYAALSAGVTVNLHAGTASDGDSLNSIEHILGSNFDDTFITQAGVNNTIEGGLETSELNGDWIDYSSNSSTDLVLDLSDLTADFATAQVSGNSKQDLLKDIENVIGTSGNDTITGNAEINTIIGNGGADEISAGANADSVQGGAGNDIIDGGSGADILEGNEGDDTFVGTNFDGDNIDGGTNTSAGDTVDYSQVATHGVTVDLSDIDGDNVTINTITHTISAIENIKGTNQADNITGNDQNNILEGNANNDIISGLDGEDTLLGGTGEDTLKGGAGNDRLEGGDDNDTLEGGSGNDFLFGGEGSDTADYSSSSSTIEATSTSSIIVGGTEIDFRNSIENIIGSNLVGTGDNISDLDTNATINTLVGLDGNDTITEGAGNDTVIAGAGDDYIYAGTGDDEINGDGDFAGFTTTLDGNDTLDFTKVLINDDAGDTRDIDAQTYNGGDFTGIEIDLDDNTAQRIHAQFGTDTITNIENVIGTGKSDYIKGNDSSNLIEGRSGNDYLIGLDGADTFKGGDGADTIDFSAGIQDVIVDMNKEQTIGDDSTYRVQNDGYANKEYIDGIEHIITGAGDDIVYGDAQGNSLITAAGDDSIRGGAGSDYIDGGIEGLAGDTVDFSDLNNKVTVDLTAGTAISGTDTDTLVDIENIIGTSKDDIIIGDTQNNTIKSGDGNDNIKAGAGQDYIDGGTGLLDTVDFSDGTQKVNIDLSKVQDINDSNTYRVQDDGFGNKEYLDGVENIIGTNSKDIIIGDSANNEFKGGSDNDTLYGNAGDDTLIGNAGNDTFRAGSGNDIIYGSEDNSSSTDTNYRDVIDYSDVNVDMTINLELNQASGVGQGVDTLYDIQDVLGSSVNDNVTGKIGEVNSLMGLDGNDTFNATLDGDFLYGGSITAGTHTDSGNDTADYSAIDSNDGRAINVDLSRDDGVNTTNNEQEVQLIGDATKFDNLEGIENIIGTQNNDIIKGSDDTTEINILDGNKGNDTFYSSDGVDSFIGGEGIDTLDFRGVNTGAEGVNIDLDQDKTIDDGFGKEDYIANDIEVIIGTTNADILKGDSANNTLLGNDGVDTIFGGSGNDSIEGGLGADTLKGDIGNDTILGGDDGDFIYGGEGDDELNGEAGNDTIYFDKGNDVITGGSGSDTLTYEEQIITSSAITVNKNDIGATIDVGVDGTDTVIDHIETIIGTGLNDRFNGYVGTDNSNNYEDTFLGLLGNDIFDGGRGDDYIDGGDHTTKDTITFETVSTDVGIDIDLDRAQADTTNKTDYAVLEDGFGGKDYVINVEDIIGSKNNDNLAGRDDSDNTIQGGDGDDTLYYTSGSDILYGGTTDTSSGNDWLSFENTNIGSTNVNIDEGGYVGSTRVYGINNIIDSTTNTGDRNFFGNSNANSFITYGGADRVRGEGGNDIYDLGDGDDRIESAYGNDIIIGGTGINTINYTQYEGTTGIEFDANLNNQTISVDVNGDGVNDYTNITFQEIQNDGTGATDLVYQVQNIYTADNNTFKDIIKFDDQNNDIRTYRGNDTIDGRGGNDLIYGGDGNDLINGGTGNDEIHAGNNNDIVYGDDGDDEIYGDGGDDTIEGGLGNDIIDAGSGDDTILNDEGIDTINGNSHSSNGDTMIFKVNGTNGVVVNLSASTLNYDATSIAGNRTIDTFTNTEIVTNIENIIGTDNKDIVQGNSSVNTLTMGNGDDTIFGSLGNDKIDGESGTDLLDYSNLSGGNGVILQLGDNARIGTDNQTITSIENARGSDYSDDITGDNGVNTLWGADSNDTLDGGANDDTLYGDDGDDTLIGGSGLDYLYGGTNTAYTDGSTHTGDTADYTDIGNKVTIDLDNSGNAIASISNGNDRLFDIENLTGSAVGDDLSGNASANTLLGNAGNDILNGEAGNDYIDGGADDDTIIGGADDDTLKGSTGNDVFIASNADGDDSIDGGDDLDIVDYSNVTGPLNVTLGANGDATVNIAGTDTLTKIEGFYGTSLGDTMTGNDDNNVFEGRDGSDTLIGNAGDDTLLGGEGDDTLVGGIGNDIIDGGNDGANGDWVDYKDSTSAININLRADADHATGEGTDQIRYIENIDVSNNENGNIVQGDANDNTFIAGTGDDTLSYDGSTDAVIIDFDAGTSSGDGADEFVDFENFIGSNQADTLINDSVKDDTLFKSYDAKGGIDTVDYTLSNQDITVNVNGNTSATLTVDAADDSLSNVEIIKTGLGDDTFIVTSTTGLDTLDAGGETTKDILQLSGNLDLSNITLLNFEEIQVADNQTLTLSAKDLDDKTMTISLGANATLKINATDLVNDHDFGGITLTKAGSAISELIVSDTLDLSNKILGHATNNNSNIFDTFTVSGDLTLDESQAISKTITGSGSAVVEVNSDSSTDFGTVLNLSTSANETIQFTANSSTFTGNFADSKVVVDAGITLTTSAVKIDNVDVNNSGNISITDLDNNSGLSNANLSTITGSGTATAIWDGTTTFTGNLGTVDVNIASGVMSADGSKVDGKTISGAGTLTITGRGDGSVDVSNITTTQALDVNITDGVTTLSGVLIDVDASDSSSAITIITDQIDQNFIGGSASDTVITSGTGVYTGTLTNIEKVSNANALSFDSTLLDAKTIDFIGSGNITITGLSGSENPNFTNITSSGAGKVIVDISSATIFTGTLNQDIEFDVSSTLTIDANKVSAITVVNTGIVNVTDLDNDSGNADANLSTITGGTVNATWDGTDTFTGNLGTAIVDIASGVMSADGSKVDGKTISGAGTLTITGRGDGNLDVSNITTTQALDINITDGVTILNGVSTNVDASGSTSALTVNTDELTNDIIGGTQSDTLIYTGTSGTYTGTLTSIEEFSTSTAVTFTANELNGKTIDFIGSGNINVSGYTGDQDLSNISSNGSGNLFLDITSNVTLGVIPNDFNINLAANDITLTADTVKIDGLIVNDNANNTSLQINNLETKTNADLTKINVIQ
ncbi:MAG: hypothetical protein ACERKK_02065, partial [Poseidonibacter sp.]